MEYLDIIYNRKTNDFNASENKIKKETNNYLNKISKKKNKLRIVGDVQPIQQSNNTPLVINDSKKLDIPNLNQQDNLKLIEIMENISNKDLLLDKKNDDYKKIYEKDIQILQLKEDLINNNEKQKEHIISLEKELFDKFDKIMNDKKIKNKQKKELIKSSYLIEIDKILEEKNKVLLQNQLLENQLKEQNVIKYKKKVIALALIKKMIMMMMITIIMMIIKKKN